MKMVEETKKIMEDPEIKVTATTVRVPVFYGHAEAVNIETEKKILRAQQDFRWGVLAINTNKAVYTPKISNDKFQISKKYKIS